MKSFEAAVWVGSATDEAALEAVLVGDRSCDGDSLGSALSRAVELPALATAIREVRVLPDGTTRDTAELLGPLSFAGPLCARLPGELPRPANAVVVFYGIAPSPGAFSVEGVSLRCLLP
ncbi:MAG: hypothetical protein JNJ54_21795 [Myxococcaceae bacterium]|nr:hypothetical protein [Myxococcaceae bacterium]